MKHKHIILASNSPRRKFLLEQGAFQFTINASDIPEIVPEDLPINEAPEYLAIEKAKACTHICRGYDELILAADTSVFLDDIILNKPQDRAEAVEMIHQLKSTKHEVITGVALRDATKLHSFSTSSFVVFDDFSAEEIDYYVDTYKPYDKAGGYGIQDWIGWCKIESIEGSYSNILGLPMRDVYNAIREF